MGWYRCFYAAGGGVNREIDLDIGPNATIRDLQFEREPPERAAMVRLRAYLEGLPDRDKFDAKDHGSNMEIGAIHPVKRRETDGDPRDVSGGVPTKPTEPDSGDRDPVRIEGATTIRLVAKAVAGRG